MKHGNKNVGASALTLTPTSHELLLRFSRLYDGCVGMPFGIICGHEPSGDSTPRSFTAAGVATTTLWATGFRSHYNHLLPSLASRVAGRRARVSLNRHIQGFTEAILRQSKAAIKNAIDCYRLLSDATKSTLINSAKPFCDTPPVERYLVNQSLERTGV